LTGAVETLENRRTSNFCEAAAPKAEVTFGATCNPEMVRTIVLACDDAHRSCDALPQAQLAVLVMAEKAQPKLESQTPCWHSVGGVHNELVGSKTQRASDTLQ
jgi:hypothetical protein